MQAAACQSNHNLRESAPLPIHTGGYSRAFMARLVLVLAFVVLQLSLAQCQEEEGLTCVPVNGTVKCSFPLDFRGLPKIDQPISLPPGAVFTGSTLLWGDGGRGGWVGYVLVHVCMCVWPCFAEAHHVMMAHGF